MEVLTLNWKKSLFTIAAIQVGTGVTIIGVLSFIPLFLVEMGVKDPGEAAFWAGLISGVTPMMVSFSAPYWTRKAEQYGGCLLYTSSRPDTSAGMDTEEAPTSASSAEMMAPSSENWKFTVL